MSRSYKAVLPGRMFRHPKGRRQAIRNEARKRAIPPDAWDDICLDDSCYTIENVAVHLHQKGWSEDKIVRHLRKKYGVSSKVARDSLPIHRWGIFTFWGGGFGSRSCSCKSCQKEYDAWVAANRAYRLMLEQDIKRAEKMRKRFARIIEETDE